MQTYVIQRLLLSIPTIFLVTILTFVGLRVLLPGSAVDLLLANTSVANPSVRDRVQKEVGLNGSLGSQYLRWLGVSWFAGGEKGLLEGNLGKSIYTQRTVTSELKRRVPVSFELGLWAQLSSIAFAIPLGVLSAVKQDKFPDYGLRSIAMLLSAVPSFWIAILIITFGSLWFNWAPPINFQYIQNDPIAHLKIILLPAIIIGLTPSGGLIRLVRTQMLEVLRQDYVRTAYAKGLGPYTVLYKHALRNALIPIVTVIGVGLPNLVAGTVIFEQIFVIPGMGRYLVDSVNRIDYPVIQALNLMFAALLIVSILLVDISYAILDPRIRYR